MIESLFDEAGRGSSESTEEIRPNSPDTGGEAGERLFLAALPLIDRIVRRRRSAILEGDTPDVFQSVALRLWNWRQKYREKSEAMTGDDWNSFAARAAYNETNRHFSKKLRLAADVPIGAVGLEAEIPANAAAEIEVLLLVRQVWQGICILTTRQRLALILHSQDLIIYLLQCGVSDEALAESLELTDAGWAEIKQLVPLTDAQIANLAADKAEGKKRSSTAGSIKKARFEARKHLQYLQQR